jgi:hypothetical protein
MTSRETLPNRRLNTTFSFEIDGLKYSATISKFADGRIGELFLTSDKAGSQSDANAKDAAILASLGFQYGVPLDVMRGALLREEDGRASTPVGMAIDLIAEGSVS